MRLDNLTGRTFGSWFVIERGANSGSLTRWLCRCRCGQEKLVYSGHLRRGKSMGCGCAPSPSNRDISAELDAEYLRSLLTYDLKTGIWTWLYRADKNSQWNSAHAGRQAGSLDSNTNYWTIRIDNKLYLAHRLAVLYVEGRWPLDEVDHENLNRSDCRWSNLREATHSQNGMNKRARSDNTSGYKGVWFDKRANCWVAELQVEKVRNRKWGFLTAEDAYAYYVEASKRYHGEFGRIA